MLTVSLHSIRIHAPIGLYPEEKRTGNNFEIDVDLYFSVQEEDTLPFADYVLVQERVVEIFRPPGDLLEDYIRQIHGALKKDFPGTEKIRVAIRKLNPMLPVPAQYSQVCYEA